MLAPTHSNLQNLVKLSTDKDVGAGGHARRSTTKIDEAFFSRPAAVVAKDLIGRIVESRIGGVEVSGIIVETAAYAGKNDPMSYEYKVAKDKVVNWQAGSLYIYSTQGHTMLTLVTYPFKDGATVLIRALEPLNGSNEMLDRTGGDLNALTRGPGKLSKALGITTELNGMSVLKRGAAIRILPGFEIPDMQIGSSKRNGDAAIVKANLRFYRNGNDWVS